MKGILITTYFEDKSSRELLVCGDDEAREIMEGRIDLDLYSDKIADFYSNGINTKVKFKNRTVKYEFISDVAML